MVQSTAASGGLRSGNPALSEKFVEAHLTSPATRSMTVAGVSIKTVIRRASRRLEAPRGAGIAFMRSG